MRKIFIGFVVLILACSLQAQVGRGNIYGKVFDKEDIPLPGVTVTLTGTMTAPVSAITSDEGLFRFLTLPPGNDYQIKAELEGFKTEILQNIEIQFGKNANLTIKLTIGTLSEEVTVTAENPLVDKKKTEIGMIAQEQILTEVPSVRTIHNIEEVKIVVGGASDVIHQTSGVSTNVITKRGGNKWAFWANAYLTDSSFQASNLTEKLIEAGVTAMAKT